MKLRQGLQMLLAGVLLSSLFLIATPQAAQACSCAQTTVEQQVGYSEHVFTGRVLSIDTVTIPERDPGSLQTLYRKEYEVKFHVDQTWKGDTPDQIAIRTQISSASCGFDFETGERYLVYAHQDPHGGVVPSVNLCSRTAQVTRASEDLSFLGTGAEPGQSLPPKPAVPAPQAKPQPPEQWTALAVAAGVTAVLLGGMWVFGRKRM